MNYLPKVVTQLCSELDLNPQLVDCKSYALLDAPLHHLKEMSKAISLTRLIIILNI